jgi:hypothetical protein
MKPDARWVITGYTVDFLESTRQYAAREEAAKFKNKMTSLATTGPLQA